MKRNLFLDANVFLSFYLFSKDALGEMEKAVKLIKDGEIVVYSNNHLGREISRNREAKIAEGFTEFEKLRFGREMPSYCLSYPEYEALNDTIKATQAAHRKLLAKVSEDIAKKSLAADQLISQILSLSQKSKVEQDLIDAARLRVELGDPPGKRGSIGDAIHWECLLATAKWGDLDIVSLDGDFASPLDPSRINASLAEEWRARFAHCDVHLFRSLKDYFKKRYPEVDLSKETEKDELIDRLHKSPTFAETHRIISKLSLHSYFTNAQIRALFLALCGNSQVHSIAMDPDIKSFYESFEQRAWDLDDNLIQEAAALIGQDPDYYIIPF